MYEEETETLSNLITNALNKESSSEELSLYPGRDFPPERLTSFSRAGNPHVLYSFCPFRNRLPAALLKYLSRLIACSFESIIS
jgi:hypothetical protein